MNRKMSDMVSGLALLGFAITLHAYLIPTQVPGSDTSAMSPQFFPKLGAILIGMGGLALVVIAIVTEAPRDLADTVKASPAHTRIVIAVAAAMAGFILLFQWFGYFYAAPPLIAVLMIAFGARKPLPVLAVTVLATAVLYAVFSLGLNLPLV
ncbi:MAG: tripartite tricarboxylate transporter TctB family protein [Albidovulum sp.]|uniref:tripartite tricarboxylate transporter TctB family protein n=1 Tax=Albidovulum sp. TaxID=1872424 RepID=UPI003CADADE0